MKQKLFIPILLIAVLFSACKKETTSDKPSDVPDSIAVIHEADTVATVKTPINWEGEYKGILPCEDCDGMEMSIILSFDYSFLQSVNYIGKGGPYISQGSFKWDESKNIVTLKFEDGSQAKYLVSEGMITLLDEEGEPLEGDDYILRK